MDAACGRRPLAQVLRNSLPGHPPLSATKRDTIQNAISSQRRERSYTPVAGDSCCDNGLFHMDAACGRRPLAQVLRNSLPGHPPLSATKRRYHNKCHIQPETRGSVQAQGYRHTVRGYDYMSDNLADDSVISIRCNALTVRRLR